ncbi:hypothetical protein BB561_004417 [Smittium simulii]|uniref:EamA domain-containing protein n=1 Tax=Smittium simulii TaxID=133385 RepID=A0A2T9YGD8_9FUNG|nr:hypothetical protein BB561_004417 [Smittium simulii]
MSNKASISLLHKTALTCAVFGGTFAACASLFAKLTVDSSSAAALSLPSSLLVKILPSSQAALVTRILSATLLFSSNALMWFFYSKALAYSNSSTVYVTATQNLANFALTAFFGYSVFGKSVGLFWWFGIFLIATGLAVISLSQPNTPSIIHTKSNPDNPSTSKKSVKQKQN